MSGETKIVLLLAGLCALGAGLLWVAADELAIQAKRADTATSLAEVAAWQVSEVLREAREITRRAAVEGGERM